MNHKKDNELVELAAKICVESHAEQTDKVGQPYILHPMRVALKCDTSEQKIVAFLHDVIEDCGVTAEDVLAEGFSQEIVDAILSVTKREGESYEDFVRRAKQNPIGRVVKLHDLEDNLNALRLDHFDAEMAARYNKYLAARRFLLED